MTINLIGVDCATEPRNVGYAFGTFSEQGAVVEKAALGTRGAPPG